MSDAALSHRELMVSGSLDRAIVYLGAPTAASALLQAGFLVVDTFWMGRVGATALAAVSTAGFVMWLAQTLGEGVATGSGAVAAHAAGGDDLEGVRRAAAAGMALAVWGSLLGAFAGAERTAVPAVLEIVLTAARIPIAVALVAAGWGVEAVWVAIAGTTVVKGILLGVLFSSSWTWRSRSGNLG